MSVIVSVSVNRKTPLVKGGDIAEEVYGNIAFQLSLFPEGQEGLRAGQRVAEWFLQRDAQYFTYREAKTEMKSIVGLPLVLSGNVHPSVEVTKNALEDLYHTNLSPRRRVYDAMKDYVQAKDVDVDPVRATNNLGTLIDNLSDVLFPEKPIKGHLNQLWLESRGVRCQFLPPLRSGDTEVELTYGENTLTFTLPV